MRLFIFYGSPPAYVWISFSAVCFSFGCVFCKTARCKNTNDPLWSKTKARQHLTCKWIVKKYFLYFLRRKCAIEKFLIEDFLLRKKKTRGKKHNRPEIKVESYLYTRSYSLHTSVLMFVDDPSCYMEKCDHLFGFFLLCTPQLTTQSESCHLISWWDKFAQLKMYQALLHSTAKLYCRLELKYIQPGILAQSKTVFTEISFLIIRLCEETAV